MSVEAKGKTVADLAALVGGRVVAGGEVVIERVASVETADAGTIAFIENNKTLESVGRCHASCLIVPEGEGTRASEIAHGVAAVIEAARPKLAFALAAAALYPAKAREAGVHATAVVAASAEIGEGAHVGAFATVGERARIGAGAQLLARVTVGDDVNVGRDCVLHPGVVLYDGVTLGERVVLHAGVVVGADGFGYVKDVEGVYHKFPQVGTVVIEDDVEIGAGSCIDRGALGATRIGRGAKIDNLVQVAHNVEIGERVIIAAQTGISGSTVIGSDAIIGGQVGFGDHARVQSGAIIGSQAGVLPGKIVRAGVWWGTPVQRLDEYKRINAHVKGLPRMREEIKELRRLVAGLKVRLEEAATGRAERATPREEATPMSGDVTPPSGEVTSLNEETTLAGEEATQAGEEATPTRGKATLAGGEGNKDGSA
ncbi:MAG: UDP-3-O-[3-hydroxymyristoyl] glucosamine N-acyltransferase [Acidobacteriota bacterium]|nr:UDP-3-O-[3-hydroxymyristoyl] glucosamine N-acyltransferase [Acidobacteriota bacterium]